VLRIGLLLGGNWAAAAASETAGATNANPAVPPPEGEKLICRKQVETGSLVKGKRTCMTRAEWGKLGDAARDGGQYLIEQNEGKPACEGGGC